MTDNREGRVPPAPSAFSIVGIGASAGGLEAFDSFFHACPADSGMAFVLVPHLDPDHDSLLTEILQRSTAMPVVEALDQTVVAHTSGFTGRITRQDGTCRDMYSRALPMADASGRITHLVGTSLDVTP
jgi:hypothetical protein